MPPHRMTIALNSFPPTSYTLRLPNRLCHKLYPNPWRQRIFFFFLIFFYYHPEGKYFFQTSFSLSEATLFFTDFLLCKSLNPLLWLFRLPFRVHSTDLYLYRSHSPLSCPSLCKLEQWWLLSSLLAVPLSIILVFSIFKQSSVLYIPSPSSSCWISSSPLSDVISLNMFKQLQQPQRLVQWRDLTSLNCFNSPQVSSFLQWIRHWGWGGSIFEFRSPAALLQLASSSSVSRN